MPLTRADLGTSSGGAKYDEAWLQALLHRHPEVFPIAQIEPDFGVIIPLCREMTVNFGGGRSGLVDNLFATRDGGLVIVEAKLWRNPQARREAVAQALDYAAAVFRLDYSQLEQQVLAARRRDGESGASLFEIVSTCQGDASEEEFHDALSRNLRHGRAILALVGDGIRDDILPIVDLLRGHAGQRFVFALVELAVYEMPQVGSRLVVPSVLAQTELIERGVIRVVGNAGVIVEAPASHASVPARPPRMSLGADEFYEQLRLKDVRYPDVVQSFVLKVEALNVLPDVKAALSLKRALPDGKLLNLALIGKDGRIDTSYATSHARHNLGGRAYIEAVAAMFNGQVRQTEDGNQLWAVTDSGHLPEVSDLLPQHEAAWVDAMATYVGRLTTSTEQ